MLQRLRISKFRRIEFLRSTGAGAVAGTMRGGMQQRQASATAKKKLRRRLRPSRKLRKTAQN
jgi:hypothetical protein